MIHRKAYYMAQPNKGDTHQILNVSMVVMLVMIYDHVAVCAPKDCCDDIKAQLSCNFPSVDTDKVSFKHNRILCGCGIPFWLAIGMQTLWRMMRAEQTAHLYFSTLNPFFFPFFNICCKMTGKMMFTLCHNDLEHLLAPKFGRVNMHWQLINYIFKRMPFARNNKLLVLGKSIKDGLHDIVPPHTYENTFCIIHPYYSKVCTRQDTEKSKSLIKIGIVGAIKEKDVENLLKIDSILSGLLNVKMYSLSVYSCDWSLFHSIENRNKANRHLARDEYDAAIAGMDYLYFPYPSTSYHLSASGAVYEAILKSKPILSVSNPYFEWLFREFGEMGVLFRSTEDFRKAIERLEDSTFFRQIKENETNCAKSINPLQYYKQLENIVSSL